MAIVGPNGAGKSTFLKLIAGEIVPTTGWINRHAKLRLARFSQHHLETMVGPRGVEQVEHVSRLTVRVNIGWLTVRVNIGLTQSG